MTAPWGIAQANLDGGSVNASLIGKNGSGIWLTVRGTYIYWTNTTGTIGRANLDGGAAAQTFVLASSDSLGMTGVAVDDQYIYWIQNRPTFHGGAFIGRVNLDGSSINKFFIQATSTDLHRLAALVTDGQHLYWTDTTAGTIERANIDGTGIEPAFITGVGAPAGLAVYGSYVYWTNTTDGTSGQTSTVPASNGASSPASLADTGWPHHLRRRAPPQHQRSLDRARRARP